MASKNKDMRRPDMIVPYVEPEKDKFDTDTLSTASNSLPMAGTISWQAPIVTSAPFSITPMRLKWIALCRPAVIFSVQACLVETPEKKAASTTPVMALLVPKSGGPNKRTEPYRTTCQGSSGRRAASTTSDDGDPIFY
ncbi:hypothetical protein BDY21DRAFT_419906 [Lineolata rhizophorae]|uniref:Uncharacterized protein n=1 Tax=Lineolata rhizophorae TaxID=578093 RepID=A0A6A6P690_9PEZI|nr:hypothetical protein BDY21DRAFT_419906 [Lineolata rhizophorae]